MKRQISFALTASGALLLSQTAQPRAAQPAEELEAVTCPRFPVEASSAHRQGVPALSWRTDFPGDVPARVHAWEQADFRTEWKTYMAAVLSEIQAAGVDIRNDGIEMTAGAEWWIAPWMDHGPFGREARLGLTKERGPDAGDLAPASQRGPQVWAIGFYNREGAKGLHDVFLDPCNPSRPAAGWTFPAKSVSFKLLFTDAAVTQVPYLTGAPTVNAYIDAAGSSSDPRPVAQRQLRELRLIQVDIAVRDPRAPLGWVFGTFVWQNNQSDLYGNLTPVGLMWGNDQGADADPLDDFAQLPSTRLNEELAGIIWQGETPWPHRPWPGFQGRVNGPADNLRSSCLSCHALAQWPRSRDLGIVPRLTMQQLASAANRAELRSKWMRDIQGGQLTEPSEANPSAGWDGATPLDYSLQLEAAFSRMCNACRTGAMSGPTPAVCKVAGVRSADRVTTPNCPPATLNSMFAAPLPTPSEPPRQ